MILPIDQLTPHPLNSNVQSATVRAKLKNHIATTGNYPAIIVRDLKNSLDYFRLLPKFQILDGQNRWLILKELGVTDVKVENWGLISDQQAEILLATLNPLRGHDDPSKRATLLDCLRRRFSNDLPTVARYVPESVRELQVSTQAVTTGPTARRVIDTGDDKSSEKFDTFYCLLDDEMKKVIDGALRIRRDMGNLPGEPMAPDTGKNLRQDYDRGRALADICAQWIVSLEGS